MRDRITAVLAVLTCRDLTPSVSARRKHRMSEGTQSSL
jgi:hypothetical protein